MSLRSVAASPDWSALDDEALMAAFAGGAEDAFQELAQRISHLIRSVLRNATTGCADETVQEVLLRVLSHAQAFDADKGSVHCWVLVIARHVACDLSRQRRPQPVGDFRESAEEGGGKLDETVPTREQPPTESVELAEEIARLWQGISLLPERQQKLVTGVLEGKSLRTLASQFCMSAATASRHHRKALSCLHRILEQGSAAWADRWAHLHVLTGAERAFIQEWKHGCGRLSQKEIAQRLGLSPATVSRLKQSALSKLERARERGNEPADIAPGSCE